MRYFAIVFLAVIFSFTKVGAQGSMSRVLSLEGVSSHHADYIDRVKSRYARQYSNFAADKLVLLNFFEQKFINAGLPPELKNIAIIESDLKLTAVSVAGAGGFWQIMPATGRGLGLTIGGGIDQRFDVYKSTDAAINHIADLYRVYKDWMLVLAAYNAGGGRVNSAIRAAGSRNIWHLEPFLPLETNLYVKKFIGATLAWGNSNPAARPVPYPAAAGGSDEKPPAEASVKVPEVDHKEVNLNSKGLSYDNVNAGIRLDVIAEFVEMNISKVRSLNKNFEKDLDKNGTASLVLPSDKMATFLFNKSTIIQESLKRNMQTLVN